MHSDVADFLSFCRVRRRLAELTCSAYARDVTACLRFLKADGIGGWTEVRPPELRRFLAAEIERRPAAASQARTLAPLKDFFRFLVENELLERNPALVLRAPKKREALPDVLDRRELARLLGAVERDDVWERRYAGRRERDAAGDQTSPEGRLVRHNFQALDQFEVENLGREEFRSKRAGEGVFRLSGWR